MTLRVAFTLIGGKTWTGGYNYLLNLLRVVQHELPDCLTPVLLVGSDVPREDLAPFRAIPGCEIVSSAAFNQSRRIRVLVSSLVLGRDMRIQHVLRAQRIDIVFEAAMYLGWRVGTPAVAWIPDFQHRVLPQFFSRVARIKREVGFRAQILSGRTVMVSSEASRSDCMSLYPSTKGRVHAVRFAVQAPTECAPPARVIADQYRLPDSYFFMPNQFWAHKNHQLVIDAMRLLRKKGQHITVMATGLQADPRNPNHVTELLAKAHRAGLQNAFIAPGLIPYEHITPLMAGSAAMLNPSLFEGWSTTVEEARSVGVPMILSDLPVHFEQAGSDATYFDRHSAASLADAIASFRPLTADERAVRSVKARHETGGRVARFARDFVHLIMSTAGERQSLAKTAYND